MDIIGRAYMSITSGNSRVEKRINMIEAGSDSIARPTKLNKHHYSLAIRHSFHWLMKVKIFLAGFKNVLMIVQGFSTLPLFNDHQSI